MATQALEKQNEKTSPVILKFAEANGVLPASMIATLKATVFPQKDKDKNPIVVTNEMLIAFLIVADRYKLNPFIKEIYAFPTKAGGIMPMVPVDGWANIVNSNPQCNGWTFEDVLVGEKVIAIKCKMYRKDREYPAEVVEYLSECFMPNKEPWQKWPTRMLRHKAFIQAARLAFSLGGIYDEDEIDRYFSTSQEKPQVTPPARLSAPAPVAAETTPEPPTIEGGAQAEPASESRTEEPAEPAHAEPARDIAAESNPFKDEKKEEKKFPPLTGAKISQGKISKLMAVARSAKKDEAQVAAILKEHFGIDSKKDLTDSVYDEALRLVGGEQLKLV